MKQWSSAKIVEGYEGTVGLKKYIYKHFSVLILTIITEQYYNITIFYKKNLQLY